MASKGYTGSTEPSNGKVFLGILVVIGIILTIVGAYELVIWVVANAVVIMDGVFVLGVIVIIFAIIKNNAKTKTLTSGTTKKRRK